MKIIAALVCIGFSVNSFSSALPEFPFTTVTEESIRKVTPDNVMLTFNVTSFDKEATTAKMIVNQSASRAISIFEKYKVPSKNISSYEVNKRAKRARGKDYNELAILGYEFTQRFEVTINDLVQYSEITNALLDTNNVENIASHFDSTQREDVEIELIKEAAKKAKTKAELMASGLGVKLGAVFAFNDTGSFSSFFATFGLKDGSRAYAMMRKSSGASNIFVPQYIEIKKSINVVYKLKN